MSKAQKSYGKNMHNERAMLLKLHADEKIQVIAPISIQT